MSHVAQGSAPGSTEPQEIVVVYCQGCVAEPLRRRQELHRSDGVQTRLVVVPCTSRLELPHLLRILERGVDGVQVVGCSQRACRFLVGSNVAAARVARARELLDAVGVGARRLGMSRGAGLDADALRQRGRQRADAARAYGPNPMRGRAFDATPGHPKEHQP